MQKDISENQLNYKNQSSSINQQNLVEENKIPSQKPPNSLVTPQW